MPTKQIKELAVNSGLTGKEYWTEVIRESQESNLSKKEFCKQRGIPISVYYYRKRKISENISSRKVSFVEIPRLLQNSTFNGNDNLFVFSISKDLHLHISADLKTILPIIQNMIGKNK